MMASAAGLGAVVMVSAAGPGAVVMVSAAALLLALAADGRGEAEAAAAAALPATMALRGTITTLGLLVRLIAGRV
jgi:hypothetical protein